MSELLIKLFIKNPYNLKDTTVRTSYGNLGSAVGIVCNLLLCAFKIALGTITGSISIVADGLNNLSDMGSSVITMIGFKLAGKPADSDHPFGHGRIEYMSAFIVAVLILLVGFELLKSSALSLFNGESAPTYTLTSLLILLFSMLIKFWMFLFNRKIGKRIESDSLLATAQDSLNDIITTGAILLCAVICYFVTLPFNLDAIMGILVAIFILASGYNTAKDTLDSILGTPPKKELIDEIEATVMSFEEFVGIHDLIVHNYGPGRQFASLHVEVPQNSDIVKCHEQIDLCEKLVCEKLDVLLVIHMDPIDVDNEAVVETRAKLSEALKEIDKDLSLHDFRMTPKSDTRTNLIFDVLIPNSLKMDQKDLQKEINKIAKNIDKTFCCVITFDRNFL